MDDLLRHNIKEINILEGKLRLAVPLLIIDTLECLTYILGVRHRPDARWLYRHAIQDGTRSHGGYCIITRDWLLQQSHPLSSVIDSLTKPSNFWAKKPVRRTRPAVHSLCPWTKWYHGGDTCHRLFREEHGVFEMPAVDVMILCFSQPARTARKLTFSTLPREGTPYSWAPARCRQTDTSME